MGWQVVERLLATVRRQLDVDVAYLAEYGGASLVVRALAGASGDDAPPLGLEVCLAQLEGRLPDVIRDVQAHRTARRLLGAGSGVRALVTHPLRLSSGHLYGALGLVSSRPAPALRVGDQQFVRSMGQAILDELADLHSREAAEERERAVILAVLDDARVHMALQPIVRLTDGVAVGVEALARFPGPPDRPPHLWFADAARHRLSNRLEEAAVRSAVALLPALPAGWRLALNASPRFVTSGRLAAALAGQPVDRLDLEITEHAAVSDYDRVNAELAPLRADGLRLSIDDTGAGFASLHHVVQLSPDTIKLDGSLTRGLHDDPVRIALARSLADFAHGIGARLVGECIETPQDLQALRALGVDAGQGYLFAAPGDPADLRDRYPVHVPAGLDTLAG